MGRSNVHTVWFKVHQVYLRGGVQMGGCKEQRVYMWCRMGLKGIRRKSENEKDGKGRRRDEPERRKGRGAGEGKQTQVRMLKEHRETRGSP